MTREWITERTYEDIKYEIFNVLLKLPSTVRKCATHSVRKRYTN